MKFSLYWLLGDLVHQSSDLSQYPAPSDDFDMSELSHKWRVPIIECFANVSFEMYT